MTGVVPLRAVKQPVNTGPPHVDLSSFSILSLTCRLAILDRTETSLE